MSSPAPSRRGATATATATPPVPARSGSAGGLAPSASAPVTPAQARELQARAARGARGANGLSTPGKLRAATVVSVLACLCLSVLGYIAATTQASALSAASRDASRVIDLQSARTDFVSANAIATNAYLVGGLEPADQRAAYDAALHDGITALPVLAGSNAQDREDLGEVASSMATYAGLVEQARANNRQGFPVGAAFLDTGSTMLREDVLPVMDTVILSAADDVSADLGRLSGARFALFGMVVAIGALVIIQVWLSRKVRRTINPGLLAASIIVVAVTLVASGMANGAVSNAVETRELRYISALGNSQALSAGAEARTAEAFMLIRRGSGQAYADEFDAAIQRAKDQAGRARVVQSPSSSYTTTELLEAWETGHQKIRVVNDAGDWDGAVALATSDLETDPSGAYASFVENTSELVAIQRNVTVDNFAQGATGLRVIAWISLLAGLVAAGLSWQGLNKRLEEYR